MERVYLDNAATTPLDPEVLESMMPYLTGKFGNPSSIYSYGRETRMAIESARKSVAQLLDCRPSELFFTSGGTESTNTAIQVAVHSLGCTRIISSPLEHHATLHTVESMACQQQVELQLLDIDRLGHIQLDQLESLLKSSEKKTLVTLMHANNEIGNLLKIKAVGEICRQHGAYFHCDMVQTIGHYPISLSSLPVDFASAAAHKFHGPKGVGLLYVRQEIDFKPFMHGGGQERNRRPGTENTYGIIGFAKALELAMERYEEDHAYIQGLKDYLKSRIDQMFSAYRFNGDVHGSSLYTVLSASFPHSERSEMLLMNLDMAGICLSGGSACSSGVESVSHVMKSLYNGESHRWIPVRFSFSRHNTREEIDLALAKIKEFL